jgi:GLPGLI family protein
MDLSFVPDKSKGEVSMGAIGTVTVIADTKTKQALTLMNMMGKKTAIESTMDAQPPKGEELPDYDVEVTNETKMILGYKCTKAIMTAEDGTVMTGWFTKEIAAPTEGQKYYNAQMPGFPLSFNVTMDGMNVQIMATAFDKKAPAKSVFDMKVPEGYEVQTMEEFQRSVSGQ